MSKIVLASVGRSILVVNASEEVRGSIMRATAGMDVDVKFVSESELYMQGDTHIGMLRPIANRPSLPLLGSVKTKSWRGESWTPDPAEITEKS